MKAIQVFRCLLVATVSIVVINGQCPWKNSPLPTVQHGYQSNVDHLILYDDGLAYGYYDVDCETGYALDSSIGGRITCLGSGVWSSPLPRCLITGRCDIPTLFNYLRVNPRIRYDRSDIFIFNDGKNENQALGGSNITVRCASGYQNIGGSFLIKCTEQNHWTTFPNCVSTLTSRPSTTRAPHCSVTDNTLTFENGFLFNTSALTVYSDNTAVGFVIVSCSSGYAIDSVSGGQYKCNNGVWSPRPYCTKSPRCSLATLISFLNDHVAVQGLEVSSQRISVISQNGDDVLIGSYMQLRCKTGYIPSTSNNFNVTCDSNGHWSSYPSCKIV